MDKILDQFQNEIELAKNLTKKIRNFVTEKKLRKKNRGRFLHFFRRAGPKHIFNENFPGRLDLSTVLI